MAAPDWRPRRFTLLTVLLAAAAIGSAGCASGGAAPPTRDPLPPQTVVPPPSTGDPEPPASPADDELIAVPATSGDAPARDASRAAESAPGSLIVIDPAPAEELRPPSLAEAAARERARRRGESQPVIVVTNDNLAQHAAGGVLTIAHSTPDPAGEAAEEAVADAAERERYWRDRAREIRERWRDAADRVPELEERAAELRQLFYSTDDPAVRDGQVKPLWDKALADLEEARYQAARGADEVAAFLEEGRRAGALPGWLREGAELEPEPVIEEADGIVPHEAQEPSIYEPPPGA